jgi:membrane protease YdiL (CAAX protease family)
VNGVAQSGVRPERVGADPRRCDLQRVVLRSALAGLLFAGPVLAEPPPPSWRALASLLVPGAGQASNGDYEEAALHFGVYGLSVITALHYQEKSDYLDTDARYDEDNQREYINRTTLRFDYAARLATDTALYSSYAAYRDARQQDNRYYRTAAPTETLEDLASAPFRWRYLSQPTTYIPLALQAWAAFGTKGGYGIYRYPDVSVSDLHVFNLAANEMTAVGEEAFFRGYLNHELSDFYGNGWGLLWSSLIFGLAHTGQGQTADAVEASLAGAYLGWLHQRNGYQMGEGVALHFWINVLAVASAIRNGGSAPLVSFRLPF